MSVFLAEGGGQEGREVTVLVVCSGGRQGGLREGLLGQCLLLRMIYHDFGADAEVMLSAVYAKAVYWNYVLCLCSYVFGRSSEQTSRFDRQGRMVKVRHFFFLFGSSEWP